MKKDVVCNPDFLTDVVIDVERWFCEFGPKGPITVSGIAMMANRRWEGTSVTIKDEDVRKAFRELQAIDVLNMRWVNDDSILVAQKPMIPISELTMQPELSEPLYRAFYGLFGTYHNPAPVSIMKDMLDYIPGNGDETSIITAKNERFKREATLKILRELRMMRVLDFSLDGDTISITNIDEERFTVEARRNLFGRVNEW